MTISIKPTASGSTIEQDGSTVVSIESDRSVDIDSGTLHVDATNNRVGIGTASPSHNLQVYSASNPEMRLGDATVTYQLYTDGSTAAITGTVGNHDLVYRTNATERMRIDSSGRVTMPYQPAFVASKTGAVTHTNATVSFQNAILNRGSHYNTSTYRFTAPVAGYYYFYCEGLVNNAANNGDMRFYKNGTDTKHCVYANENGTAYKKFVGSVILNLSVNDYVEIFTIGSQPIYGSTLNHHTTFGGYLIG